MKAGDYVVWHGKKVIVNDGGAPSERSPDWQQKLQTGSINSLTTTVMVCEVDAATGKRGNEKGVPLEFLSLAF